MESFGYLKQVFDSLTLSLDNAALSDHRGQILHLKNPHPFDAGTWGDAFKWALKYFQMNAGDVLVFNDPFSGGNDYSVFSFITCLQKNQDSKSGVFLGQRCSTPLLFQNIFKPSKMVFRVPLTPIAQNGQIQTAILDAMSAAPGAPEGLKQIIETQINKSSEVAQKFKQIPTPLMATKFLQSYLDATHAETLSHLKEKPWGEVKNEMTLDTEETLKLLLEINENGVKLDFVGTSQGKEFFLPPAALSGVGAFFLSHYWGLSPFMNEGLLSVFQVSQPTSSCLSAKFPTSTARGYKLGPRVLGTFIDTTLNKLHPRPHRGLNNYCGLFAQIVFPNRTPLEIFLPNGLPAAAETEGLSGVDILALDSYPRVENIENTFPVRFQRVDLRNSTQGKGKVSGGRGLIHKIMLEQEAEIFWISDLTHHRFGVQKHQTSPDKIEIHMSSLDDGKHLPSSGHMILKAGEILTFASGSGGGLL